MILATTILPTISNRHLMTLPSPRKSSGRRKLLGFKVHEHLIINMDDDRYYSFADQGIIARMYSEIG
jgi:hypothetical protein